MSIGEEHVAEEVVGLSYHFLPPTRMREVDAVLRILQEDTHLEFLLAILDVTINDRPAGTLHSRNPEALLGKILQALDESDGGSMLCLSPYNDLGEESRQTTISPSAPWNFDLSGRLHRLNELRSIRMFLEHGSGMAMGRDPQIASEQHDRLLRALTGSATHRYIWGCTPFQTVGTASPAAPATDAPALWPARDISPWFHGVFWDDLLFVMNLDESTLTMLALTSS